MANWRDKLLNFKYRIDGATAVEYGLLVGLMAIGLAAATGELATITNNIFDFIFSETDAVSQNTTSSSSTEGQN